MILRFTDHEGDPIAIESGLVWMVTVGAQERRQLDGSTKTHRVTLLCGPLGTVCVEEPAEDVIAAWIEARKTSPPMLAGPALTGWEQQYPHPSSLLPASKPPWAPRSPTTAEVQP